MKEELKAVVRYKRNYGSGKAVYFVEYEYKGDRYITGTVIRNDEKSLGWYFGKGVKGLEVASEIALLSDEEFSKAEDEKKYSWELKKKELLKGRKNKLSNPNMEEKKLQKYKFVAVLRNGEVVERYGEFERRSDEYFDWKSRLGSKHFQEEKDPTKVAKFIDTFEINNNPSNPERYSIEYISPNYVFVNLDTGEEVFESPSMQAVIKFAKEMGLDTTKKIMTLNPGTEEEVMEVKEWLDKIRKERKNKGAIPDKIVLEELKKEAEERIKEPEQYMKASELKMDEPFNLFRGREAILNSMEKYGLKFHFVDIEEPYWQNERNTMVFYIAGEKTKGIEFAKFITDETPDEFMDIEREGKRIIRLWWD